MTFSATAQESLVYRAISDRERGGNRAAGDSWHAARLATVRPGARLLDAGAGQGWHVAGLRAAGNAAVGIDADDVLVGTAKARYGDRAPVRLGMTQQLPYPDRSMDAVLLLGTSLGYGDIDDDRATLANVRRVLRPGAAAVLETVSAASADRLAPRCTRFADATTAWYLPRFDRGTQILMEHQSLAGDRSVRGSFGYRVRAYTPDQLACLLGEAGFDLAILRYGDLQRSAYVDGDTSLVLVARTREPLTSVRVPARWPGEGRRSRTAGVGSSRAG